ncbi:MAG: transglycosylase SLT domain-containing protein [Alkalilacustris sp.]
MSNVSSSRRSGVRGKVVAGLALVAVTLVAGCSDLTERASRAVTPPVPATQWDHRPEARDWTLSTMGAIATHARPLIETPLADIDTFCPGYNSATDLERKAFWVGLFSGLARYESTWNPRAAGAGGRYRGLLQIFPQTARFRGCEIDSAGDLFDGATNLSCAARIAAAAVARDGVVAGGPGNWGGVAADWPPLRDAGKRARIAEFTRAQSYCQPT